jgi:hypothetical protein
MFKVWQNLAPFGSRPIGGAVEALLTKTINRQLSVPMIVFFLSRRRLHNDTTKRR